MKNSSVASFLASLFFLLPSLTYAAPSAEELTKMLAISQAQIQQSNQALQEQRLRIDALEKTIKENLNPAVEQLKSTDEQLKSSGNSLSQKVASMCPKYAFVDGGYGDDFRGLYNVDGCMVFCRWVGNSGSGGDPAARTTFGSSFWACANGQEYEQYGSFPYKVIAKVH